MAETPLKNINDRSRVRQDLLSSTEMRTTGNFTTMSPLNNSTSKQLYSFSKSDRFMKRRMYLLSINLTLV